MPRRLTMFVVLIFLAAAADAQTSHSSFSIGPRLSSYSTDIDSDFTSLKTGRQTAFGLVGDYRTGHFVLDFQWDHDPSNGIHLTDLLVTDDYDRDRGEVTIGYAISPLLDLEGGFRTETISLGSVAFFGTDFFDHQAITAGIHLHSDLRQPVRFHFKARGYFGSAKIDNQFDARRESDTNGWRAEGAVEIRIGESKWSAMPGIEYEKIDANDAGLRLNTNRFFVNVVYRTR